MAELDICKIQVMAIPTLRDDLAATVELYSTFIKKMKTENSQLNVSEVSFACGKGGKNLYGWRGSYGISNVSNAAVDDRFFEKHEYHAMTPEQNNILCLKRLKHGHVGNGQGGGGNGNGKGNGKGPTLESLNLFIVAMGAKFDKFILPNSIKFNVIYFNCAFNKLIFPKEGNITLSTMPARESWVGAWLSNSCSPSIGLIAFTVTTVSVVFCIAQIYFG
jgi:hypothetical protein